MKKIISIIVALTMLLAYSVSAYAYRVSSITDNEEFRGNPFDTSINKSFDDLTIRAGRLKNPSDELLNSVAAYMGENDRVIFEKVAAFDEDGNEVEIKDEDDMIISFSETPSAGDTHGGHSYFGKDIRIYYINDKAEAENIELQPKRTAGKYEIKTDKLGLFAIIDNPYCRSATFYSDVDELYSEKASGTVHYQKNDILYYDTELDMEKPSKPGYEFVKWIYCYSSRYEDCLYENDWIKGEWFAQWIPSEEYTPIEISLYADEEITRGSEDGKTLTLKISDGSFPEEVKASYIWIMPEDNELKVDKAEVLDEHTLRLTLSGNSQSIYGDKQLFVGFESKLVDESFLVMDEDGNRRLSSYIPKINSNGTICEVYKSDNSVTLHGEQVDPYIAVQYDDNTARVTVSELPQDYNARLMLSAYDESDRLVTALSENTQNSGKNEYTFDLSDHPEVKTVKAFLWDNDDLHPMCNAGTADVK